MRNFFLLLIFCFGISLVSSAQSNVVKTGPVSLAFGNINVRYEKVLNESSSIQVKGNYWLNFGDEDVQLYGGGVGWRYFFTHAKKPVPAGFYIMPFAEAGGGTGFTRFGFGAELGYQWVWDSGFVLDLGLGPCYVIINDDNADDLDFGSVDGILPTFTTAIGYAF
ncbi:MAG: DUF3575 domain-containing protein [Saprospiraceae bacterium]|nr:DUF3575 domain-containing protein [Saprospiraceae bacterium]